MEAFRIREAAELLGVSDDTLRRWADAGRVPTTRDSSGRRAIDGAALARFAEETAAPADRPAPASGAWPSRPATGSPAWSPG